MRKHFNLLFALILIFNSQAAAQKITWQSVFAPGFAIINDAAFAKGRYVVVGDDGTVLHSRNGQTWSKGKLPDGLNCNLNAVTVAFGQFWAGGVNLESNKAVLLLSLDGVNWSDVSDEMAPDSWTVLSKVEELFTFAGESGEVLIVSATKKGYTESNLFYSTEGSVWKESYNYGHGNMFQAKGILYSRDSTYNGWGHSAYSSSSEGWVSDNSGNSSYLPSDLRKFAYANSYYVGVGPSRKLGFWDGVRKDDYYYSGQFTYAVSPVITDYTGVAYGGGAFVASGTQGALVESYDNGKSWFKVGVNVGAVTLNGVKFVGGKFIAFGGGRIITGSPVPQRSWQAATLTSRPEEILSLATNGKVAIAVGAKGQIHYSYTGTSWKKAAPVTSSDLYSVDYDSPSKAFYATGADGTLLRSGNGVTWTVLKSNTTDWLYGVARAGDALVAAGAGGAYLTSKDGKRWISNPAGSIGAAGRLVNFGNRAGFVQTLASQGMPSGQVWMNPTGGSKWTKLKTPDTTVFNDAGIFNSSVYLAGNNGFLYSSPQKTVGGSWSKVSTRTLNSIFGLAENSAEGGQLTAVGEEGLVFTLLRSGKWKSETIFEGSPSLSDVIYFKQRWVVAGSRNGSGFIATTLEK